MLGHHIYSTKPAKWEIQTRNAKGWYNCWSLENGDPELFDSFEAAHAELLQYHSAGRLAVMDGDIERHMPDDYRITVYAPSPPTTTED